ncbi:MAG: hypothetical protein CVU50_05300 [Candidatus Cloacimonetes bacterium HGW-Cloacimonetes-3]|jgi:predicted phosphodiesterase|nr:MAG: hypothetical protein CVU50_05300 [Candidatus Cloacimonetes bacterium HGW-Cloacimonetes-3]
MKKHLILTILSLLVALTLFSQPVLSCYDVQYTALPQGDSPYLNQSVIVQGIVTGVNFFSGSGASNYGFFIADAGGGAFSGLFVYNQQYSPNVGDIVKVTGTVAEYYGFTEIISVTAYQVISQNNTLPVPSLITTAVLSSSATAEQWESVLVKVQNANVTSLPTNYQEFNVSDGSGNCQVDNQFFPYAHTWQNIAIGNSFTEITGIVDYAFSTYGLQPRSLADMQTGGSNLAITLPNLTANIQNTVNVPVNALRIDVAEGYQSYSMNISFNPNVLVYQSVDISGTLSATGSINVIPGAAGLAITYSGLSILSGEGALFKLIFMAANTGVSQLALSEVFFGQDAVQNLQNGSVTVNSNYNAPGDILTVIQRPIMNIPAIQIPGENMGITCLAPQSTTGFNAWILHGNKRISMPLVSATWQTTPNRWELLVTVPQVNVFELYDLEVNASEGIHDITRNAVQVIPSRKSSYYFIHITDLHMPTRINYPDAGYNADSLAVVDFRAVMDDINLVRPEFVLLTGDLINEGELEGFNGQYWYGWVQRVLAEMKVPVYVTSGNHDIGGWYSTPPVAGSSRRNWWKYFGWSWLDNTDVNWPYHTQDYFFTYGNTMFIGLESYDNYDNWRPTIYGNESYTNQQMAWLSDTTSMFPDYNKVLFHHYDFQSELNLSALGIDMALWGHTHSNSGSLTGYPLDISTRSTCDGNRAYRVVRVANDQFTPTTTIYAGNTGGNLSVNYYPSNYAVADSVMAVIYNGQSQGFDNTLLLFNMPAGNTGYTVSGGILEQVDRSGANNVCYVRVNLLAYSNKYVSIKTSGVANEDALNVPSPLQIASCYPNPMMKSAELEIESDKTTYESTLEVYNLKGQKVQELILPALHKGSNRIAFIPAAELSSGIYYFKLKGGLAKPYRFTIVK